MEPGGSMPHSQGLPNNPYPESNQPNPRSILIFSSHLRLGLPKGIFHDNNNNNNNNNNNIIIIIIINLRK